MDTKPCPKCGEEIKAVAVRCKHCQADLAGAAEPDFDRGHANGNGHGAQHLVEKSAAGGEDDFEQRFLEFAYKTTLPLNATSVAYALSFVG